MKNALYKNSKNTKHYNLNKDAHMTIKKLVTLAFLTCLSFTINADAFQDMKNDAEADFDLEFGGCDAKVAKQQSQIEQLQIHLEDSKNAQSGKLQKIATLQNQLALQTNGVNSQLTDANQQVQAYSNALNEQKRLNNQLVSQINVLKLKMASNNVVVPTVQTSLATLPLVKPVLDSSIDVVTLWDDALWNWSASGVENRLGLDFAYICPKNGSVGRVTGTGHYAIWSSVCTAAVHAGLISVKKGGKVIFRIGGSKNSFRGSNQNRVQSAKYGSRNSHFTFPPQ